MQTEEYIRKEAEAKTRQTDLQNQLNIAKESLEKKTATLDSMKGTLNQTEKRQKLVLPYLKSVTFANVSRCFENKNNNCYETQMPVYISISGHTAATGMSCS